MHRRTLSTWVVLVSLVTSSCHDADDASQATLLAAPANLSVSEESTATAYGYTFTFNAVEFAQSYLIYYSPTNDSSTAISLAAGPFSPIGWSYNRPGPYGGQTYYFWVRAYDGKNYGHWSSSISAILY